VTLEPDEERGPDPTRTLRVLTRRTPVTTGWRAPDTVRRAAVRRARARWATAAGVLLVGAVAAALSVGGGTAGRPSARLHLPGSVHTVSGPDGSVQLVADVNPVTTASPSAVDAVVAAEQRLSLALLKQVGDGSNVTVSPASLYFALGMLQNGARGATADEISKALQASGLPAAEQNAGLAALTHDLATAAAKDGIDLASANSLWQQRGFTVKKAFLAALAAYYQSGVWQVDFAHHMTDALSAIDAWTSDHTHGKITKLFDSLDPATVLVLANAVYFHAAWQTAFDKAQTEPGAFTTGNGGRVTAQFMSGGPGLTAVSTKDYQAVELPYRGGRFAALAIMPANGSLTDFVTSLTPDMISSIAGATAPGLSVSMPRFTTTSKLDLKGALEALGMQQAFSGAADFSGLSSEATAVDQVIQRDYLQVGEYGTTAAAVTGIGMVPLSLHAGPQVQLDHPFLFLVRDTHTGAILFASEITDPTAS
jgi:serpin B